MKKPISFCWTMHKVQEEDVVMSLLQKDFLPLSKGLDGPNKDLILNVALRANSIPFFHYVREKIEIPNKMKKTVSSIKEETVSSSPDWGSKVILRSAGIYCDADLMGTVKSECVIHPNGVIMEKDFLGIVSPVKIKTLSEKFDTAIALLDFIANKEFASKLPKRKFVFCLGNSFKEDINVLDKYSFIYQTSNFSIDIKDIILRFLGE